MFDFTTDTPILISVGTLITVIGMVIKYTNSITKFKEWIEFKNRELELKNTELESRITELEGYKIGTVLIGMQKDIEYMKMTLDELKNRQ